MNWVCKIFTIIFIYLLKICQNINFKYIVIFHDIFLYFYNLYLMYQLIKLNVYIYFSIFYSIIM